jgi:hypothetical protein
MNDRDQTKPFAIINQNVTSTYQTGGITAHTVNFANPRRIMGSTLKKQILDKMPRDKQIVIWSVAGNEETHAFATEIFNFMKEKGFDLFGEAPFGNIFLTPPKGILLREEGERRELDVGFPDGAESFAV